MPRSPNETTPSQFRLSEETLAALDAVARHYGLTSRAAAIRVLAAKAEKDIASKERKNNPKKTA